MAADSGVATRPRFEGVAAGNVMTGALDKPFPDPGVLVFPTVVELPTRSTADRATTPWLDGRV